MHVPASFCWRPWSQRLGRASDSTGIPAMTSHTGLGNSYCHAWLVALSRKDLLDATGRERERERENEPAM